MLSRACIVFLLVFIGFLNPAQGDPVEFNGYVGAGSAFSKYTTTRGVGGFDLQFEILDFLMLGALVETGLSIDDSNPEDGKWISELSLAPIFGARIDIVDGLRFDIIGSFGWTHLFGSGSKRVSSGGDMAQWRAAGRLTFSAFKMYGHQMFLGGWFGVAGYPLGSEAGVGMPKA